MKLLCWERFLNPKSSFWARGVGENIVLVMFTRMGVFVSYGCACDIHYPTAMKLFIFFGWGGMWGRPELLVKGVPENHINFWFCYFTLLITHIWLWNLYLECGSKLV